MNAWNQQLALKSFKRWSGNPLESVAYAGLTWIQVDWDESPALKVHKYAQQSLQFHSLSAGDELRPDSQMSICGRIVPQSNRKLINIIALWDAGCQFSEIKTLPHNHSADEKEPGLMNSDL